MAGGYEGPQRGDSPCSVSFSGLEGGEGGPGQLLRVHCATFNMSSKFPGQPLPPALLGLDPGQLHPGDDDDGEGGGGRGGAPDLLAFATQVRECWWSCGWLP